MLVYANHFNFEGTAAAEAVQRAIGAWLKEQLGFGLHPDQLRKDGEYNGTRTSIKPDGSRSSVKSWLRIVATVEDEPELCVWTVKSPDETVRGRQWITELGVKRWGTSIEVSCVVKTDEQSILAARHPVTASRPRVIGYILNNIRHAQDAEFASSRAVRPKNVGADLDSYRALKADIEHRSRDYPIVLVSPTREGDYLFNVIDLQEKLAGLAQVVQVDRNFNSYDMANVIGEQRSAWSGAVNVIAMPNLAGAIYNKLFLSNAIEEWGPTQNERISHLLAWVTNSTNIPRLRNHIRPEGVLQLALKRRMQAARAKSEHMNAAQLREELENAAKKVVEQDKYFEDLVKENDQLEESLSAFKDDLEEAREELGRKDFTIEALKTQLDRAGVEPDGVPHTALIDLACRSEPLLPLECLDMIEKAYGDRCIILPDARNSAERMSTFVNGQELIGLLKKLVTDYRDRLLEGGDSKAREVFGRKEYAAKESETVMNSKPMRRQRTFVYEGGEVEMFRHLKIGVDDDVTRTIRVHFHWDSTKQKIVIGYCGKHLNVSSY